MSLEGAVSWRRKREERKGEEGCEKLVLLPSYGYGSIVCCITLGFVILNWF